MKRKFVVLAVVAASLIAVQCGGSAPETEAPVATEVPPTEAPATEAPTATEAPPTKVPVTLDGKSLLEERCTRCHDLGRVERAKKTEEEWKANVERMVGKGAQLNEAEQELVIKYLAETYPQ